MSANKEFPLGGPLDAEELRRYSRHLVLPELGETGQRKLKGARVLLVGAGGLGSPAALYLAAAGVGELGLVDFDAVDASNLQRQILHGHADLGRKKIDSAAERIADLNPGVRVKRFDTRLAADNVGEILADYDIVVDGSDNFPTRYMVSDACVLMDKVNVYGSVFRFEGQASVFAPGRGPCYRCFYPEPPPAGQVPSCAEGGVIGALPGIIGTVQAIEAIKIILGVGEPLIGRLLLFDALAMSFKEFRLDRDPSCPSCGDSPTILAPEDLPEDPAEHCALGAENEHGARELTPAELKSKLDRGERPFLLDVREEFEWRICKLDGARLIPLARLPAQLDELEKETEIVVYCHTGMRSAYAVEFLRREGFARPLNLLGGIHRWALEVDPETPTY